MLRLPDDPEGSTSPNNEEDAMNGLVIAAIGSLLVAAAPPWGLLYHTGLETPDFTAALSDSVDCSRLGGCGGSRLRLRFFLLSTTWPSTSNRAHTSQISQVLATMTALTS